MLKIYKIGSKNPVRASWVLRLCKGYPERVSLHTVFFNFSSFLVFQEAVLKYNKKVVAVRKFQKVFYDPENLKEMVKVSIAPDAESFVKIFTDSMFNTYENKNFQLISINNLREDHPEIFLLSSLQSVK
jgi:hypothetical protein